MYLYAEFAGENENINAYISVRKIIVAVHALSSWNYVDSSQIDRYAKFTCYTSARFKKSSWNYFFVLKIFFEVPCNFGNESKPHRLFRGKRWFWRQTGTVPDFRNVSQAVLRFRGKKKLSRPIKSKLLFFTLNNFCGF